MTTAKVAGASAPGVKAAGAKLFRAEAIAFQREAIKSGAVLPIAPPAAALTWLLFALIAGLAGFLATCDYARKQTVTGFLAPTLGVARIVPPRAGLITAVHVTEGQDVVAGAALLTVQVGQSDGQGGDVDETVMRALTRQRAALRDQIAEEEAAGAAAVRRIGDSIASLEAEVTALQSELVSQRARGQVADEQVSAVRDLVSQGYISVVEFKRRQDNALAQRQSAAALMQQIAQKRGEAAQQRHALAARPGETEGRVATLRGSIAEIDARTAETEGRRAYLIRAPVSGRVSALQARVGLTADPAIPQLAIIPSGSVLRAELLIPARAIGFVEPGQVVRLAYDAFPFQRFGFHGGHVETVSATLLRPAEVVGPVALSEPSYRVTVALDRQNVDAFGRSFSLGADMAVKADIVFDRRSLVAWLLEPILSMKGRWS